VGVGTTTPTAITNFRSVTVNGTTGAFFDSYVGGTIASRLDSRNAEVALNAYGTLAFGSGSGGTTTERMRITDIGRVGIGTTGPATKLEVSDGAVTAGAGGFVLYGRNSSSFPSSGSGYFALTTNNVDATSGGMSVFCSSAGTLTERMRIDSSGNVGIGVTSLSERFQVAGTGDVKAEISTNSTNRVAFRWKNASVSYIWQIDGNDFRVIDETPSAERLRITSTGLLQFNSGYGSAATAYGVRAWVNFNGQGTPSIRASGNVSSITDNGTGQYAVNFSNAFPDTNYSASAILSGGIATNPNGTSISGGTAGMFTTYMNIITSEAPDTRQDYSVVCIQIFR
jgi:hypothetical protein